MNPLVFVKEGAEVNEVPAWLRRLSITISVIIPILAE